MSWDVKIIDKEGKIVRLSKKHTEGGTYQLGGTDRAELNVTYNYSEHFTEVLGCNFRELDGKTVKEVIPILEKAVKKLGDNPDKDYWKATKGNAGHALTVLLDMVKEAYDMIFSNDMKLVIQ